MRVSTRLNDSAALVIEIRDIDNEVVYDVGCYERSILRNSERTIFREIYCVKNPN